MKVVTANRLIDGTVVYLGADGRFVECMSAAAVAADDAAETAFLATARQAVAARLVVSPYSFDVVTADGAIAPTSTRERLRAAGPSVRPDLGKQAAASR